MIALLKYGSGLPFHRLERLQGCLGIPLPAATQWEIVKEITGVLKPAYQELIRQAAQGEVVYNDESVPEDRKSTRLNSSHLGISYAVFCLKKKKEQTTVKQIDRQHSNCM